MNINDIQVGFMDKYGLRAIIGYFLDYFVYKKEKIWSEQWKM